MESLTSLDKSKTKEAKKQNGNANSSSSSNVTYKNSLIVQKMLENLIVKAFNNREKLFLDDYQLKRINLILSNLPFESIRQSYDKYSVEQFHKKKRSFTKKKKSSSTQSIEKKSINSSSSSQRQLVKSSSLSQKIYEPYDEIDKEYEGTKSNKHSSINSASTESLSSVDAMSTSNPIVIHVCDEGKRLKQDFFCPRELLVKEMKYFSYNLNMNVINSQNTSGAHAYSSIPTSALSRKSLDEIDISVHCDINIFDWLMRFVKRKHPNLIEKTIATPANYLTDNLNHVEVDEDGNVKSVEPKFEINNCISILLSSDFLIMNNLVDKCILFIVHNIDAVLQVPCVMTGINEKLLNKIAACINTNKLDDVYDKKDKLKTKLFQRKIEFLFDINKYKQQFETSRILNNWKHNNYCRDKFEIKNSVDQNADANNEDKISVITDNYMNYLYECENDASTLFRCKICSHLMTKTQAVNLKCQLAILSPRGEYIYLHVPDEKFDPTNFLQLLKDKLKTWQHVYWFLWALIKSFKCKKCLNWFRLVEINKCRLNAFTFCPVHDSKLHGNSTSSNLNENKVCSCIYCSHIVDNSYTLFSHSPIFTEASATESPEMRLAKFNQLILDTIEKHKDVICCQKNLVDSSNNETIEKLTFCDFIENILQFEQYSKNANFNLKNCKSINSSTTYEHFIDSISGKHVSLINKNVLNLIRTCSSVNPNDMTSPPHTNNSTQNNNNFYNTSNPNLDFKNYLNIITKIDAQNIFNSLDVLQFLKVDPKMKWDILKPTRLNQDNQREDDLKKFREISSYLIKTKIISENQKPQQQRSPIAILATSYNPNQNTNYIGGMYCRVENEWKQRMN